MLYKFEEPDEDEDETSDNVSDEFSGVFENVDFFEPEGCPQGAWRPRSPSATAR